MLSLTIAWLLATVSGAVSAAVTLYVLQIRPLQRQVMDMRLGEIEDYANHTAE